MHQPPKSGSDPKSPVHIVFVGAGAVGCFYASRLHHPTHNVFTSLIARSNYSALTASGVTLQTHTFGNYTFTPHAVFPSVAAAAVSPDPGPRPWDYVIVTTKALPDLTDDAALIAPLISPRTTIVLIQNGVGVEAPYRARFPHTPIISAVTVVSAEQTSPGTVRQNRWTRIHLGPYSNSASFSGSGGADGDAELETRGRDAADRLGDYWTRLGGIRDVEVSDEIGLQIVRWHKLCINAAFNPSAVLAGGRGNADMVSDERGELRVHLAGVMREIWDAMPRILGRPFPEGLAGPEKIIKSTERNVGSRPSMLLDWEAGRHLELEVILGNPVRIARGRGVELPRMQAMYALLGSAVGVREREREREREKEGKAKL